jgi:predicted transcriptional regulator
MTKMEILLQQRELRKLRAALRCYKKRDDAARILLVAARDVSNWRTADGDHKLQGLLGSLDAAVSIYESEIA